MIINVNTNELIKFSKKLDLMGKSQLPKVVKNTLNTLAFDVKKKHLHEEADKAFEVRNKAFYKRFSRVDVARGNDINSMKATVGIYGSSQAVEDQSIQQKTGRIGGRTLIPLDTARVNNDHSRGVKVKNRVGNLRVVMDTKESKGRNHKRRFVKTAIQAVEKYGSGVVIKHTSRSGKQYLSRIESGRGSIHTRQYRLKVTPLYSVKRGRSVRINQAKPFTLHAANRASKDGNKIFIRNAQRMIKFR